MDKYREHVVKAFEEALVREVRSGDKDLVIAPKGMSHGTWLIANDIAMMIRIAPKGDSEVSRHAAAELLVDINHESMSILEESFPGGPAQLYKQLLVLMMHLAGLGFGPILNKTASVVFLNKKEK